MFESGTDLEMDVQNFGIPCRGATTAEKLRGLRFEPQHQGAYAPRPVKGRAGCWVRKKVAPSRCEGPGVSPPGTFFENSDAKSCILVTTCYKISCFLKLLPRRWGTNTLLVPQPTSWGTVSPVPTVVAPMIFCLKS